MVVALTLAGVAALRIVQQCGSQQDLHIGAFLRTDALAQAVNALDVIEPVHGVHVRVPLAGFFQGQHGFWYKPPFLEDILHQVTAEAIGQVPVIIYSQHQYVSLLAGVDGAELLLPPDGSRGVDGGRCDGLRRGEVHGAAGQRDNKLHVAAPGGAGIQV